MVIKISLINKALIEESEILKLPYYTRQEEPDCAFFGFKAVGNYMVESGGKLCALAEPPGLCQGGIMGNPSSWLVCPLNTRINRSLIEMNSEKIKVFPKEFYPPDARFWEGITLKKWLECRANLSREFKPQQYF